MEEPRGFSFTDRDVQRCPFSTYDTLRDERSVYKDPVTGNFVLTRYEDIRRALLMPKALSNRFERKIKAADSPAGQIFSDRGWLPLDTLVTNDPPSHRLYRTLVDKVFTPPRVAALEPRISQIVDSLVDTLDSTREIDFLDLFAVPLPMLVIAEQLGVASEDMPRFKVWSDVSVEGNHPMLESDRQIEIANILVEMQHYMVREIVKVRETPNDKLISHLVHAETDGRRLNERELLSIIQQLLVAGNETTTTALASGMKLLIEEPGLADRLHANPDEIPAFVEETLRLMAPIQTLMRRAVADMQIGDVEIPAGSLVEVRFGAANRDPRQFGCPAEIDLERENGRSHLAFGAGIHMCIGNQLARGELAIAFRALTRRLCNFRATRGEDSYGWLSSYITYGLSQLWMRFDRR